jgi:hypothetical protein
MKTTWRLFKSTGGFSYLSADMGSTYLKPYRTLIGFALSVVESATAVCAGKEKDGLPLVLFIERLFFQPSLSLSLFKI